jgi:hypothetical protein
MAIYAQLSMRLYSRGSLIALLLRTKTTRRQALLSRFLLISDLLASNQARLKLTKKLLEELSSQAIMMKSTEQSNM